MVKKERVVLEGSMESSRKVLRQEPKLIKIKFRVLRKLLKRLQK